MAETRSITVYLLRPGLNELGDYIEPEKIGSGRAKDHPISIAGNYPAELWIEKRDQKPPTWSSFFEDHVEPKEFGLVSSAGKFQKNIGKLVGWRSLLPPSAE